MELLKTKKPDVFWWGKFLGNQRLVKWRLELMNDANVWIDKYNNCTRKQKRILIFNIHNTLNRKKLHI